MKIIYKNEDNGISIIHPTEEALKNYSINQIAGKDVPEGIPYWIVEDSAIPEDRTFRNAWEFDYTIKPNGVGSAVYTF